MPTPSRQATSRTTYASRTDESGTERPESRRERLAPARAARRARTTQPDGKRGQREQARVGDDVVRRDPDVVDVARSQRAARRGRPRRRSRRRTAPRARPIGGSSRRRPPGRRPSQPPSAPPPPHDRADAAILQPLARSPASRPLRHRSAGAGARRRLRGPPASRSPPGPASCRRRPRRRPRPGAIPMLDSTTARIRITSISDRRRHRHCPLDCHLTDPPLLHASSVVERGAGSAVPAPDRLAVDSRVCTCAAARPRWHDPRMRIALADDADLLREALASALTSAGFEVVGQAADADRPPARSSRPSCPTSSSSTSGCRRPTRPRASRRRARSGQRTPARRSSSCRSTSRRATRSTSCARTRPASATC